MLETTFVGVLFFTIFLQLGFALILVFGKLKRIKANRVLALLLVVVGVSMINFALERLHLFPDLYLIGFWLIVIGPAIIYLYVRVYFRNAYKFEPMHLWHLLPLFLQFVLWIIYVNPLPVSEKEALLVEVQSDHWYAVQRNICVILLVLGYAYLTIIEIITYKARAVEEYSYSNQNILNWLYLLIFNIYSFGLLVVLLDLTGIMKNFTVVIATCSILWTTSIILIVFLRPEIYQGIGILAPVRMEPLKGDSPAFSDTEKAQLFEKLIRHIESDKTYLNSGLTLKQLSDTLSTNQSYLSKAINGIAGKSFFEFINAYRIEYAKDLLGSETLSKYTIEGIAKASGFRSRSAFYSHFKKYTGVSPTTFVSQGNTN